jgi:hypothetical protein
VEHWDGVAWTSVPYPRDGNSNLIDQVDATASTGYTWLVGQTYNGKNYTAFADAYIGPVWRDMRVRQAGTYWTGLSSVAPVPRSPDVWVVGSYADSPSGSSNLAERYTCR